MGIVLKKKNDFEWPVVLKTPGQSKYEPENVVLKFKYKTKKEIEDISASMSYGEFCKEAVIGWCGVKDESGSEIEFSLENLDMLLDIYPTAARTILVTYLQIMNGEAQEKN